MPPNMTMRSKTGGAPPSTSGPAPSMLSSPARSAPPFPLLFFAASLPPAFFGADAPSLAPAFFFVAANPAAVPFSEPADRALTGPAAPAVPTGFHSFTAGAAPDASASAAASSILSFWVGGGAAAPSTAVAGEDGNAAGSPCDSWVSSALSMSSPVTGIAACRHRCPERPPMPPVVSNDDQFKPRVSSKKIVEGPQFFPPPRKTTVVPSQTGVAVWYAAGGGLSGMPVVFVRKRGSGKGGRKFQRQIELKRECCTWAAMIRAVPQLAVYKRRRGSYGGCAPDRYVFPLHTCLWLKMGPAQY